MMKKQWYTEASREKGKQKHKLFNDYLLGKVDYTQVSKEGFELLEKLQGFVEKEMARPLYVEELIVDVKRGYAGTPDLVFVSKGGGTVLIDWKNQAHADWHKAQAVAYAMATETTRCLFIDRVGIVYTNTINWKITYIDNVQYYWESFLHFLGTYQFKHGRVK